MQLAILHYHLNSGGVARVIHNHLLALAACDSSVWPERVLLLQGREHTSWPHEEFCRELPFRVELVTVDGLDYDDEKAVAGRALGCAIEAVLRKARCDVDETIVHWHNPALGKNMSTPLAVAQLAESGYRTLAQIHDFAEDFRPANYLKLHSAFASHDDGPLADKLYPQAPQIHYAVLNGRDLDLLQATGVNASRLHLVPNPVADFGSLPPRESARKRLGDLLNIPAEANLFCYPVRGIRRKNLGEMLLWSTLLESTFFFVTLAPENPAERASFDRWQSLAEELGLRCRFGQPTDEKASFQEILAASDTLITTSVAEGFGMAFLECWLAERPLLGRNLAEITGDACAAGLDLAELYEEVRIPSDWIDRDSFTEQILADVEITYGAFGISLPPQASLVAQISALLDGPTLDFAHLPSPLQVSVIRKAAADRDACNRLAELNPKLLSSTDLGGDRIAANAMVVRDHYSLVALGKQLAAVYTQVMKSDYDSNTTSPANGGAVLDAFLRIDRLHPVRVEP